MFGVGVSCNNNNFSLCSRKQSQPQSTVALAGREALWRQHDPARRVVATNAITTVIAGEHLMSDSVKVSDAAIGTSVPVREIVIDEDFVDDVLTFDTDGAGKSTSSSVELCSADATGQVVSVDAGPTSAPLRTSRSQRGRTSISDLKCCCGCGLKAESVEPCEGCNNLSNGVMRRECASVYRRCAVCVTVKLKSRPTNGFIYSVEEIINSDPDAMVMRRLTEPNTRDMATFQALVLASSALPTIFHGKGRGELVRLMSSYGTEEQKKTTASCVIIEDTMEDAFELVVESNPHMTKRYFRGLRYLSTTSGHPVAWWINSVIIEDFIGLVNKKTVALSLKAHCTSQYLFVNFETQGYKSVKKWSANWCRSHMVQTIFDLERLVVPLNLNNEHWVFMVAHMRHKRILYYDSISGYDQEKARKYLTSFHT